MTFAQDDSLFDVLNEFRAEETVKEENIVIKQRTDRKLTDYKQVIIQKKEKVVDKSIDLSMGIDDKGQPFKVITSEQYILDSKSLKQKGMIDISMDFFQDTRLIDVRQSKITPPMLQFSKVSSPDYRNRRPRENAGETSVSQMDEPSQVMTN